MGRKVKGRAPVKLNIDNDAPLGSRVGFNELSEGGQDAEKHAYPMLKQKKKEGRFAVNTLTGGGSKNKGPLKGNK